MAASSALDKIRLFFSPHYAMERFSAVLVLLICVFIVVISWCIFSIYQYNEDVFHSTAIYEESIVGTQSGVEMTPIGLAVNEDRTRAAFVFQFSDATAVPAKAEDYKVHITGVTPQETKRDIGKQIAGSLYLYNTDGYGAVYLVCPSGFNEELFHVTIEATKLVSADGTNSGTKPATAARDGLQSLENSTDAAESASTAATEEVSDRFAFTINPGASDVGIADSLEGDFDSTNLFCDYVLSPQENDAKENLEQNLVSMKDALNKTDEYLNRLAEDGMDISNVLPAQMAGDTISTNSDGDLELNTSFEFPGTYHLDWRGGDLESGGYVKDVNLGGRSLSNYLSMVSNLSKDKTATDYEITWMLSDGTSFADASTTNTSSKYTRMKENITAAQGAIAGYIQLKQIYQTSNQQVLLELENDMDTVATSTSANVNCLDIY